MYSYGIIGNCSISAYISHQASIDWLCLPRPDSAPIFGKLLDDQAGHFSIQVESAANVKQSYLENTNILETLFESEGKPSLKVTDFCPRFRQHERMFRPSMLIRILEPNDGVAVKVQCKVTSGWEKQVVKESKGNSHLRYELESGTLRVLTNIPLTYLLENKEFFLTEKAYLVLSWDQAVEEDLADLCERFLQKTEDYWKVWVKHCSIPTLFQKDVIRSALALKLHCYEDTGAILAALSTSLPEEVGGIRNWDYRFCWIRDAYFSLTAFRNLGHFEEMEGFLRFLTEVARDSFKHEVFPPVFRLDKSLPLPEQTLSHWDGWKHSQPVREGNQAAEHIQLDAYGEMILSISPIFFDQRFSHLRTKELENLLWELGKKCEQSLGKPDAGLWEIRGGWKEHTFSNLMSWAGLDRLHRLKRIGFLPTDGWNLSSALDKAIQRIQLSTQNDVFRNSPSDDTIDASLVLSTILKYPNAKVNLATLEEVIAQLQLEDSGLFYRYKRSDDFGSPDSAFLICSFWVVQALARHGQRDRAFDIFCKVSQTKNRLGLFSEHFDPRHKLQLGNFPQAYSHVGFINAAFDISPDWNSFL